MRRLLLFLVLCLMPTALLFMYGCGPRGEVAKKRVLDRLDAMLGKMDVHRAEIDDGIKATKKAVEGIRKARITAQVKLDQIDEKKRLEHLLHPGSHVPNQNPSCRSTFMVRFSCARMEAGG
jgi:hypothetical protein